jgi:hypothetical protein
VTYECTADHTCVPGPAGACRAGTVCCPGLGCVPSTQCLQTSSE